MFRSNQIKSVAIITFIWNPMFSQAADLDTKTHFQTLIQKDKLSNSVSSSSIPESNQFTNSEDMRLENFERALGQLQKALLKQQRKLAIQEQKLNDQTAIIEQQDSVMHKQSRELLFLRQQVLPDDRLKIQRATGVTKVDPPATDLKKDRIKPDDHTQKQSINVAEQKQSIEPEYNTPVNDASTATRDPNANNPKIRPQVPAIPEVGGVLTPRGRLILEPGLQASHSSFNRFTFLGVEIVNAFLVGLIQAEDTDRDFLSAQLTARYGITSRLEAEFKVPYIYRRDSVSGTIPQLSSSTGAPLTLDREFDGNGLGDIELALHYQINSGLDGWPFFVGNLRWKSDTGEGPFDVNRDSLGREAESPTGSGFHSLEPSLTILYPSDPAVFFGNVGYLINFARNVNKTFVQQVDTSGQSVIQTFGRVDPGNTIRLSFGMGYALNDRTSLTIGYKHDFIDETDFEINGVNITSNDLDVGSLLLGWGFAYKPGINFNLNLELGITQDAPDVLITLRVPFTAYQF